MQKTSQMRTCQNRALTALVSESDMHQGDITHKTLPKLTLHEVGPVGQEDHGAAAPEEPETDVVRLELITL